MKVNIDDIVLLDEVNMGPIIEASGGVFLHELRKKKLEEEIADGSTIITEYDSGNLAGYVQYNEKKSGAYYVSSIQVHPRKRDGVTLRKLLKKSASDLIVKCCKTIESSVHKNNEQSIRLHERLGFEATMETGDRIVFSLSGTQLKMKLLTIIS